jgi:hypothetical protein
LNPSTNATILRQSNTHRTRVVSRDGKILINKRDL